MNRRNHSPTYTKKHIVQHLASANHANSAEAALWIDRVLSALRQIMTSAQPELRIEIRDFGVFEVKLTKPKPKARNPRTGEIVFVPSRRKTHFKPGKLLRAFLSGPVDETLAAPSGNRGRSASPSK